MGEWREVEFGKIPKKWDFLPIINIKSDEKHSIAMGPFGSNIKSENFVNSGIPVIRGNNFNYHKFISGDFVYLTKEKANELKGSICRSGDLVFTHRGTIGQVGLIPKRPYTHYVVSQSGMKLTVNQFLMDPEFLFYFFISKFGQYQILKYESQVGVPSISNPLTSLKQIEVPVPPLPEQKAIASVLSSLDDKIDLLHRQNKTLEAMAEMLFRQWFVEEAQVGWEEKPLSFFGDIICGKTPLKKIQSYFNGKIPFIKIPDMHGNIFLFETTDSLTEEGKLSQSNKTLPPKSICVSCIATVGLVSMNAKESQTNQQINSIIPKEKYYRYFLYLLMKSYYDLLHSMASGGTATLNLNTGNFSKIPVSYPGDKVLVAFQAQVESFFDKIFTNQSQIRTLEKLRDTLLPKLMSGEVRVEYDES